MSHDFQSLVPPASVLPPGPYVGPLSWGRDGRTWKSEGRVNAGLFGHLLPSMLLLSGLSIFICKMEHLGHMGWPRQHVPDQNILSWPLRPQRWDRARDRLWKAMAPRPGGAWSGVEVEAESSRVSVVPSTPAIFTPEHCTARGLAKNTSSQS